MRAAERLNLMFDIPAHSSVTGQRSLTSLPSVMVKSRVGRGHHESSSECRARTLCVCAIFVRGVLVWIFGADFSVRIFRCGFFVRLFFVILVLIVGRIFCGRPQGERQKIHQKSSPKSSPTFPLQKSSPKSSPNLFQDVRQDIRQSVLTWTQRKCGCTP